MTYKTFSHHNFGLFEETSFLLDIRMFVLYNSFIDKNICSYYIKGLKDDIIMFNSSFSIEYSTDNAKSGTLYSKLETGVIAVFNPNGKIKPLFFQYTDLYGDNHNIKIDNILSSKEEHYAGLPTIVYSCDAIIQNKRVQCILRYHVTEHHWELLY
jgi:hypothetical protein